MTTLLLVLLAFGAGLAAGWWLPPHGRLLHRHRPAPVRNVLLPFTGVSISQRAVDAAMRLAQAEHATLMPAYLAVLPMHLPPDAPLPRQCTDAMPLLEALEQRATVRGVAVDSRVARGRSYRDALRKLLSTEQFDRVVVPATAIGNIGFNADDLIWLLERAPPKSSSSARDPRTRRRSTPRRSSRGTSEHPGAEA